MLGRFWLHLCDFLVIVERLLLNQNRWMSSPFASTRRSSSSPTALATWNVIANDIFFNGATCLKLGVSNLEVKGPYKRRGFILSTKMKNVWKASRKLLQISLILKPSITLTGSNSRYYQKIFEVSELCSEVAIGVHYKLIRINQRWLPQQQKISTFQSQQKQAKFPIGIKDGMMEIQRVVVGTPWLPRGFVGWKHQESGRHGYLTWGADHLNLDAWFLPRRMGVRHCWSLAEQQPWVINMDRKKTSMT